MCKYSHITVELIGNNGSAFAIMGSVTHAMRINGVPREDINIFKKEALSGDYDHLLQTCMTWVNVE